MFGDPTRGQPENLGKNLKGFWQKIWLFNTLQTNMNGGVQGASAVNPVLECCPKTLYSS